MQDLHLQPKQKSKKSTRDELTIIVGKIESSVSENVKHLNNATLMNGWLGAALFYYYYAQFAGEDQYHVQAENYVDNSIKLSGYKHYRRIYRTDSYDANIANLGIFLLRSKENGFISFNVNAYLQSIENILHELCKNKIKYADFSILSGALAAGSFLIRAPSSERNNRLLCQVVNAIALNAISDSEDGIYWTSPRLDQKVYLGLSHGSCMIISFLSDVFKRGLLQEKCQSLIQRASRFVLKHQSSNLLGLFPNIMGEKKKNTQFTLCYGDLGVGYALLKGALSISNQNLISQSKEILKICSQRNFDDNLTFDAGITYGASGVSYLYEKIAALDPSNEGYLTSHEYWISQIPKYSTLDGDYCGFRSHFKPESNVFNLSYSWGIMGIGITLMRYLNRELPMMEGVNDGI